MGILEIYLLGWLITGSVACVKNCGESKTKVITKGECIVLNGVVVGALWPVVVPVAAYDAVKK